MSILLTPIVEAEALREYLHDLNESGTNPITVGVAANGQPFLITLVGAYAEGEEVFFDSPWQQDTGHGSRVDGVWVPKQPRCDECLAQVYALEDLSFPVTIMEVAQ